MNVMTDTTSPPRQGLPELERITLRYYTREALGIDNTGAPLGGLTVERFKLARARPRSRPRSSARRSPHT
jgi:hypothetical protein